jgi:hypothetical protein
MGHARQAVEVQLFIEVFLDEELHAQEALPVRLFGWSRHEDDYTATTAGHTGSCVEAGLAAGGRLFLQ